MNTKELTQSIIAVIVVIGAIVSLFTPSLNDAASQTIRVLAGTIVGYYFGASTLPAFGKAKTA